ncbi:inverse autotransporter beta domain-containing protein [Biostraticola tofi]|uniref:Inverse autotransporter-like protein with beta domain n=1 Tax=Biostraticola tofi TaxID=466109 RepID=A0A4R3YJ61_9GAMM|nr:inverse autotransporter beta domain-containing protein [Biostraticola tofi]TCV92240.1 inverse autotransporter-like protein with beta domain [Biostraticola tofi]
MTNDTNIAGFIAVIFSFGSTGCSSHIPIMSSSVTIDEKGKKYLQHYELGDAVLSPNDEFQPESMFLSQSNKSIVDTNTMPSYITTPDIALRANLAVTDEGRKENSLILLSSHADSHVGLIFNQLGLHQHDHNKTLSIGVGHRILQQNHAFGYNVFWDNEFSGINYQRMGMGVEYFRDYLHLSVNGYTPLRGWHSSAEPRQFKVRPASGYDIQAMAWLPNFPQLSGQMKFAHYLGGDISISDRQYQGNDPYALSVGVNYRPIAMLSLGIKKSFMSHQPDETSFDISVNYLIGTPLNQQITQYWLPAGNLKRLSQHFVERSNIIALQQIKPSTPFSAPNVLEEQWGQGEDNVETNQQTGQETENDSFIEREYSIADGEILPREGMSAGDITLNHEDINDSRGEQIDSINDENIDFREVHASLLPIGEINADSVLRQHNETEYASTSETGVHSHDVASPSGQPGETELSNDEYFEDIDYDDHNRYMPRTFDGNLQLDESVSRFIFSDDHNVTADTDAKNATANSAMRLVGSQADAIAGHTVKSANEFVATGGEIAASGSLRADPGCITPSKSEASKVNSLNQNARPRPNMKPTDTVYYTNNIDVNASLQNNVELADGPKEIASLTDDYSYDFSFNKGSHSLYYTLLPGMSNDFGSENSLITAENRSSHHPEKNTPTLGSSQNAAPILITKVDNVLFPSDLETKGGRSPVSNDLIIDKTPPVLLRQVSQQSAKQPSSSLIPFENYKPRIVGYKKKG